MTDSQQAPYGDAITVPFWEAAARHELVIQRCRACHQHQFYPRRFCLACDSDDIEWTKSAGTGTVYSATTVRMKVAPDLVPPYVVAIVELDEGPRMLTNVVGGDCPIGQRVRVTWKERTDAPPLPLFEPISG